MVRPPPSPPPGRTDGLFAASELRRSSSPPPANLPDGAQTETRMQRRRRTCSRSVMPSRTGRAKTWPGPSSTGASRTSTVCLDLLGIYDEAAARLSPERFAIEGSKPSEPLKRESQLVKLARKRLAETADYYDRMAQRRARHRLLRWNGDWRRRHSRSRLSWLVGYRQGNESNHRGMPCCRSGRRGDKRAITCDFPERFRVAYDIGRRYIRLSGTSPGHRGGFRLLFYFAPRGWVDSA